mmetsp:Transcript_112243/g.312360  ORF Transcript_112243/g.312360 Transcript_112243/m.312360 type:complete len:206 (-) Transcript_112243:7-624(-)
MRLLAHASSSRACSSILQSPSPGSSSAPFLPRPAAATPSAAAQAPLSQPRARRWSARGARSPSRWPQAAAPPPRTCAARTQAPRGSARGRAAATPPPGWRRAGRRRRRRGTASLPAIGPPAPAAARLIRRPPPAAAAAAAPAAALRRAEPAALSPGRRPHTATAGAPRGPRQSTPRSGQHAQRGLPQPSRRHLTTLGGPTDIGLS